MTRVSGTMSAIVMSAIVGLFISAGPALACSVCYGDPNSAQVKGAEAGILVLFGVIGTLLLSIVGVALFWMRRARALASIQNGVSFPNSRQPSGFASAD